MAPEPIIHNSPALDSLKHQQLRSLCARHGLKSTGKRDHLIRRLKGLREGEHGQMTIMSSPSAAMSLLQPTSEMDEEGLDGSYDFADDTIAQTSHVQVRHSDPFAAAATASNATNTGTVTSRVSTDEFGALSADANTMTKSSSWKDKLASVFGTNNPSSLLSASSTTFALASSSSGRGLVPSHSSGSLSSSTRTLTLRSGLPTARSYNDLQESTSTIIPQRSYYHTAKGSSTSIESQISSTTTSSDSSSTSASTQIPPTPAFRIVDDSFAHGNQSIAFPDCSFVPRTSFEGNSVDLTNVPVWPPRPGVILISPRQSPSKVDIPASQIPNSVPQNKRQLDDVDEDQDEEEENDIYNDRLGRTIRMVPKAITSPGLALASQTPGRRIAHLPKRMSSIAASPPRFDLEAPALPSFATVTNQAMLQNTGETRQDISKTTPSLMPGSFAEHTRKSEELSESPVDPVPKSKLPGDVQDTAPSETPFVFGSSRQQPLSNDTFLQRIDGFAISKQLEELQRRTGLTDAGNNLSIGSENTYQPAAGPSFFSSLDQHKRNISQVRFNDKHQEQFNRMDSIANHYAAKRKPSQPSNKRTRTESSDNETVARADVRSASVTSRPSKSTHLTSPAVHRQVSCPMLSVHNQQQASGALSLNQQGRYAPLVPPRPKAAKTSSQQEEDRRRIQDYQNAAAPLRPARRAGASVSPRKAVINPSLRKLPPLTGATDSVGIGASSSTAAASRLFKSTMSSLKSFGSSSSLSNKAAASQSTTTANISVQTQNMSGSEFGTIRRATSGNFSNSSLTRPTVASLARQASRQDVASSTVTQTMPSYPSHGSLKQALSPRTGAQVTANLLSPRTTHPVATTSKSTLEKKKLSSISAAHRSSPMKSNLDDSIANAKRIRAKKLNGLPSQQSPGNTLARTGSTSNVLSPSKSLSELGLGATARGSSIAARPIWR